MLVFDVFPLSSEFLGSLSSRLPPSIVIVLDVLEVEGVGDGLGEGVGLGGGGVVFGVKFA